MFYIRISLSILLVLAAIFLGGYLFYQGALNKPLSLPEQGLQIEITKGESLHNVLSRLHQEGVLKSMWPARVFVKEQEWFGQGAVASKIQAGEFNLLAPLTVPGLITYLSSNNQISYSLQFIEGSRFSDALSVLAKEEKLKQLLPDMSSQQIAEQMGLAEDVLLEGQIYPDTYAFHKGDTDVDILLRAHAKLKLVLEEEWQGRQTDLPLNTPYEALILASIIEKETGVPEERPEIAGVFIRRLQQQMRLQTDPTVIYGLGERYQGNITAQHLREETPYNTYRISGLPPTPIALVGRAAIHAALHPAAGETLYFVAKGDGSHQFSKTLEEHNQAVKQYQLNRRKDYRSSVK